jgi:predicted transcriptional regulator
MPIVSVVISDECLNKLKTLAERSGATPEALVQAKIRELVEAPEESFERAAERVLDKNQELYRRLA